MAVEISKAFNADVVLVIAPLNTVDGWESAFTRQGWPHPFRNIKNSVAG